MTIQSRSSLFLAICLFSLPLIYATGSGYDLPGPFDPVVQDTIPLEDRYGNFMEDQGNNPFDLEDPSSIEQTVEYDPVTDRYIITEKIGDMYYRAPTYMTFAEYLEWSDRQQRQDYFQRLQGVESGDLSSGGNIDPVSKVDISQDIIDRLFGGNEVDIRPQGSIDLTFGGDYQRIDNPILLEQQRNNGGFDFDMDIQVSVTGKIGEKLSTNFNYNTQSTFAFENKLKLDYNSEQFGEDDIIKKIEAGDVSLPLRGSLIQGSQSLFGIKTELQFGRLRLTAIASQQRSENNNLSIQGGSVIQDFQVPIDEYDDNRHFFLSHYNRETFERALKNLPQIESLFRINRIEVWVTNDKNQTTDVRDVVALADIGEARRIALENADFFVNPDTATMFRDLCDSNVIPANQVNTLLTRLRNDPTNRYVDNITRTLINPPFSLQQTRDFEKVRARKLSPSEFTYNPELGFISLNFPLRPDQVLGVAYEYTYNGINYQVGELTDVVPVDPENLSVLFVKMLKATNQRVDLPIWDLMMKNFYFIGGYDINPDDFELDVFYENLGNGFQRFLPAEAAPQLRNLPLITILNLDNLNATGDPQPDGRFDFVEGLTINTRQGRIMFPLLEPFGSSLERILEDNGNTMTDTLYTYQELYDSTKIKAQQFPESNRYVIKGRSQSSSSSDISLGAFNIPPGSVRVTAGGQVLQENVDYIVDYNIGRLKIINDTYLQPGTPINVSFEDNALFSFQKKTMIGLRADYEVSKHLNIGGTYMHLFERPYTQKVNIGDDPINNRIYGLDLDYSNEAPWLTRFVDNIPLINTKEPSTINFQAEVAALKPGHSRAINGNDDKAGVVYIDDFEGTSSEYPLENPPNSWRLASTPQGAVIDNQNFFPEAGPQFIDSLITGYNRAHLSWYRIDRIVRNTQSNSNPYTAAINQREIFQNRTPRFGPDDFRTFDLRYQPTRRGQYNFDPPSGSIYSSGLNQDCSLANPMSRWAGIQRDLDNTDFEQANFEAIEFWMLNPFELPGEYGSDGYLVFNLGNVSEDVLRDSRLFYEHGLPRGPGDATPDTTNWGLIPRIQPVVNAFSNDIGARERQDVGLDGMDDNLENIRFASYINAVTAMNPPQVCLDSLRSDPSNDQFVYFRDDYYDQIDAPLLERYSQFNGTQGNSPATPQSAQDISANTNIPDSEDLNQDNSLNESESYFQYVIPIRQVAGQDKMQFTDYVTDTISNNGRTWYRFRIPLTEGQRIGGITDFRSIRFLRMYMTGFERETILRFATLDLVRSQWRRYTRNESCTSDVGEVDFSVDAVSVEEHAARVPFPYVIPPGITRERIIGSTYQDIFQNEQSLSMKFCELPDGCDVRVFKPLNLDMRVFENLQMFVHGEQEEFQTQDINDGELKLFLRFGSDFENNYYEYEIPLFLSRNAELTGDSLKAEIWKDQNFIDFALSLFTDLKIERNNSGFNPGEEYRIDLPPDAIPNYSGELKRTIAIKGNPNLGYVKNLMIGIRNMDGGQAQPMCGEVWVNELRASGLDERGGVAATARLDMQLADFGELGIATTYSSIGYGAIDQKLDQRAKESVIQFDASAGLQLGKFFGDDFGLKIPFYAQYSITKRTPRFDPYDFDIELDQKLAETADPAEREIIKEQAQDVAQLQVLSVTNMRKEKTNQKAPMPWDISNFTVSYSYAKSEARNEILENSELEQHRASLDYNYSLKPLYIQPLKNVSKSKWLKPVTEIHLNPIPNNYSFTTILDRRFGRRDYRFSDPIFKTWYDKRFTWERKYNLKWDLTRSIRFDYNAINDAVIDEPDEYIDRNQLIERPRSERRDSIWENIKDFGRTKNYSQNVRGTYNLPTRHFPFLDWIRADISVDAAYFWTAASLNTESLGNVIRNGQGRQFTADLDFSKLYDKSPYLRKINNPRKAPARSGNQVPNREKGSDNQPDSSKDDGKDEKKKEAEPGGISRVLLRPLMAVRKFRFNYSHDYTTVIPGFTPQSELFGMQDFNAPGWDFIFGFQPTILAREQEGQDFDFLTRARDRGWLAQDPQQNQPVIQTESEMIDGRLTIEPFRDFKVDIDAKRNYSENFSVFYKNVNKLGPGMEVDFERRSPREVGSFTMTYLTLPTLFMDDREELDQLFKTFERNRLVVSEELGLGEHAIEGPDYTFGYGSKQRDVIIPSFIAAYTDDNPMEFQFEDVFDWIPKPNWQLTYNGLHKIPLFQELFSSVSVRHGYKNTLTINNFETDLNYTEYNNDGVYVGPENVDNVNPTTLNYYSQYILPSIIIDEQFSPLIGVEIKTKNDISLRFDYIKRRGLSLGFTSFELAEDRSTTLEFGFDYAIKNVLLPFMPGYKAQKQKQKKEQEARNQTNRGGGGAPIRGNDLEFLFDFSFTDNITLNHYLDQESLPIPTRGTKELVVSPAIRYNLNKNVDLRFFVNYRKTEPYTSNTFKTIRVDGGITVQVTLD